VGIQVKYFIIGIILILISAQVFAETFQVPFIYSIHTYYPLPVAYNVQLNKTIFSPGETIYVTGDRIQSWSPTDNGSLTSNYFASLSTAPADLHTIKCYCNGNFFYLPGYTYGCANTTFGYIYNCDFANPNNHGTTFTAPLTPGKYSINLLGQLVASGSVFSQGTYSLPFTVAGTTDIDCGLRGYDGTQIVKFACEPQGTVTSKLRIRKGATTYGVILVPVTDSTASKFKVQTSSGVKALKKI